MPPTIMNYAFPEHKIIFAHPAVGPYQIASVGIASLSVGFDAPNTAKDRGADGSVMFSKITANDGHCSFQMKQKSPFHFWLKKYWTALNLLPAANWPQATINILDLVNGEEINLLYCAPEKRSDLSFAAQGTDVTWNFLFGYGTLI